ncbi:class I SAM-dependent methyltransferase [Luminiphilus sp.]|nr:class I SAM-dependent methyltransferase [Luminiphilus sp.]
MSQAACHHCNSEAIDELEGYAGWCSVTSDCRKWRSGGALAICRSCGLTQKPITAEWSAAADEIYAGYVLYHQSPSGVEQMIAGSSGLQSRSVHLVDWIRSALGLSQGGDLLDFGCGTGSTLRAVAKVMPQWKLSGMDPNIKDRAALLDIEGVCEIHEQLDNIDQTFDLITLIHVFEHIPDPAAAITGIRRLLKPNTGRLLIQVPYFLANPFDLMIADHSSHYTLATISNIVSSAGYEIDVLRADILKREITVVAKLGKVKASAPRVDVAEGKLALLSGLEWLVSVQKAVETFGERDIGVFGTSIAAAWISSNIDRPISLYLDEDLSRVGGAFFERPIYLPKDAPQSLPLYIPLVPELAARISSKLTKIDSVSVPESFPEPFLSFGRFDAVNIVS